MACDVFPHQIFPSHVAFTSENGLGYSLLIGTNDANVRGLGNYEANFQNCQLASITWIATRPQDKTLPGDPSVQAAGACTSSERDVSFQCNAAGSLTLSNYQTTGNAIYVWYGLSDSAPSNASFTVRVDGSQLSTITKPSYPIATQNNSISSIGVVRLADIPGGSHNLIISTSVGSISILGVASNRANKPIPLAVGDLPNQRDGSFLAPLATQLAYINISHQNIDTAIKDGLDVRVVNDRDYMLGYASEMSDRVHPNKLGHNHLYYAFSAGMP